MTDEEDEFIEESDHQNPKCGEIMQMLQNLRLFRFNEQLSHEYLHTFDLLESESELNSTQRKQTKLTDYFKKIKFQLSFGNSKVECIQSSVMI